MQYEQIEYRVEDRIATVTLNRPSARNGYTIRMADELAHAFRAANADEAVRVVVITGTGKDFCVGADLSGGGLDVTERDATDAWVEPATRATRELFELDKPVIAALRGAAVGVGSTLVLAADIRVASTDSRFGFVFSRRGIYPEGGSTWFLPRLVGLARALEWMLTGRLINADEALGAGLVTALHEPDVVLAKAYELARDLAKNTAPVSAAVIRKALYRMSAYESPHASFELDSKLIASCATNPDATEGVLSFLQKRAPAWKGSVATDVPPFLPWRQHQHQQ